MTSPGASAPTSAPFESTTGSAPLPAGAGYAGVCSCVNLIECAAVPVYTNCAADEKCGHTL